MNSSKRFLSVFTLLAASVAPLSMPAAVADPAEKVLTLSMGMSRLFLKELPQLSVRGGSLAEKETSIALEIDKEKFANYKDVAHFDGFYRETRNFRDGEAAITMNYVDGTISTEVFSLSPEAPGRVSLVPKELLLSIEVEVTGTVDIYTCFDANNCVFEKTETKTLTRDLNAAVGVKQNYRPLLSCRSDGHFINIEGSVDNPEVQRLIIHRRVARRILKVHEVITGKSIPINNGAEFVGFTTEIGNFGMYAEGPNPGTTLQVTRENENLSVITRRPDGSFRTSLELSGCVNVP